MRIVDHPPSTTIADADPSLPSTSTYGDRYRILLRSTDAIGMTSTDWARVFDRIMTILHIGALYVREEEEQRMCMEYLGH